jgi:hypothetical protein
MQFDMVPFQFLLPITSGRLVSIRNCTTSLGTGGSGPGRWCQLVAGESILVPILVQVGLPFQCFVPWELMSFTLPENEILSSNFAEALRDILAKLTPASERRMRELLAHFARDLLWRTDARRVSENILLEALRARTRPPASGEACCPFRDRTDWPYA